MNQDDPIDPPAAHLEFRSRPFRPARWLRGTHLQTLAGKYLRKSKGPPLERFRVETPDGDFVDLDLGPDPGSRAPIVLILHGLEGSTRRAYVRVAMSVLSEAGILPVGMNFRSCSGVPNRKARSYHSGETGDLSMVLGVLRERFPARGFGALGFSLGGNVLLKYLGEQTGASSAELLAAAAISVPYDLTEGSRMLERGWMGRVYTRYFLRSLQEKARDKEHLLRGRVDFDRVLQATTLREFDEAATAPLHGFESAAEYYRLCSSKPLLPSIRVPTLLIHAMDDPFLPPEMVPRKEVATNPWLADSFHPHGGHVGFIESPKGLPRPPFWAEREAVRYLTVILRMPSPVG